MKKTSLKTKLLLLLFMIGSHIQLSALKINEITNQGTGNPYGNVFSCETSHPFVINVANLEVNAITGQYQYPEGVPTIIARYTVGDEEIIEVIEGDLFQLATDFVGNPIIVNNQNIYNYTFHVTVNVTEECRYNFPLNWSMEILVFDNDFNLIPYPIQDHARSEGIFSCEIFDETEECCENRACTPSNLFSGSTNLINCDQQCPSINDPIIDPNAGTREDETNQEKLSKNNILLQVSPNPFLNTTTITLELVEAMDIKINIYNSMGQIINNHYQENIAVGTFTKNINTDSWIPGIYFAQIQFGNDYKIIKLLKSN